MNGPRAFFPRGELAWQHAAKRCPCVASPVAAPQGMSPLHRCWDAYSPGSRVRAVKVGQSPQAWAQQCHQLVSALILPLPCSAPLPLPRGNTWLLLTSSRPHQAGKVGLAAGAPTSRGFQTLYASAWEDVPVILTFRVRASGGDRLSGPVSAQFRETQGFCSLFFLFFSGLCFHES